MMPSIAITATNPDYEAVHEFERAYESTRWQRLLRYLRRQVRGLTALSCVERTLKLVSSRDAGIQTVELDRIRGSESRSRDFTEDFRPLQKHTRDRWMRVWKAYQAGVVLPPVDLVQVGEDYYVRDGHHRISVAHAVGQESIDARVTIWTVLR